MRLKNYITEKETKGLGITFVDLDETLFNTFAKINVIKNDKIIKSLTNAEYNSYKKEDGETFDYSEFRNAKLFYDTSKPVTKMIKRVVRIINHSEQRGSKVIILTARTNLDNKSLFLEKFRKEGFPIDKVYVERAGNRSGISIPYIKKEIIVKYLKDGVYRRVRLFDDYLTTCKEFLTIKQDIPTEILNKVRKTYNLYDIADEDLISFESYNVQPDGSVKEIK